MSDIGEAREILKRVARELRDAGHQDWADQIVDVVDNLMHRQPPARGRMPATSNVVTSRIKAQIRKLARTTSMHNAEIAAKVGVNPGRVSEVLHEND